MPVYFLMPEEFGRGASEQVEYHWTESVGEEVPGAGYDVTNCIPEGSEATLRSFRHIGPYSLYSIDLTKDL